MIPGLSQHNERSAMDKVAPYYKAVAGALVAFLSAIAAGLAQDGLSGQEWITAAIAFIVGLGAVFAIPNIKSNYPPEAK